jgi:hypothetical protein
MPDADTGVKGMPDTGVKGVPPMQQQQQSSMPQQQAPPAQVSPPIPAFNQPLTPSNTNTINTASIQSAPPSMQSLPQNVPNALNPNVPLVTLPSQ